MSLLIRNGTLVTMDNGRVLNDGALYIEGTRIVDIGPAAELARTHQPDKVIDASGKIVMPGLIDAHFHTCQQFLRGMLNSLTRRGQARYPVWKNYLIPFESLLSEDDVYLSGLAAYTNMIKVGTTCASEHGGRHVAQMARAMSEVGLRGLLAESTMDVPDPELPANMVFSTEEAIARNTAIVERWGGHGPGLLRGCFSLRQVIVCTPRLFQEFARLAKKHDALVQMHLAEGSYEIEYVINHYGVRPAEYLERIGVLGPRMLFAHSVLLSDHEVDLYARYGIKAAHCPTGNFTLLGMTKFPLMKRGGVAVGLGSDGAANGSIDLFQAMNLSLVGQLLHNGTPYMDRAAAVPEDLVKMATIDGARAVRWEEGIGSLEVGKLADVIVLDPSHLDSLPVFDDVYYTIVKCLKGRDVETVVVNGQLVMEKRQLLTVDEGELRRRLGERIPALHAEFQGYCQARR